MSARLRARAARLMRQLDAGAGYREQIERDLAKRLGDCRRRTPAPASGAPAGGDGGCPRPGRDAAAAAQTANDADARFCKGCGARL